MSHRLVRLRFLPILVALNVLSALTLVHAQQPTSYSAQLAPGLTLLFETASFIPSEHEVVRDENGGLAIDGCEQIFGTDNATPTHYLREAHVLLEGQRHALDTSCMYTCDSCSFFSGIQASPNPGGAGYRLEGSFSDGAGTYYATGYVTPTGTARTRIVSASETMMAEQAMLSEFDMVIDEVDILTSKLEDGTATPADAEGIRLMIKEQEINHLRQMRAAAESTYGVEPVLITPTTSVLDLAWVQDKLNELGYDCGAVDGLMGSNTRRCIRVYQEDNGLSTTGYLDDATTAALRKLK